MTLDFKATGSVGFGTSGAADVLYLTAYSDTGQDMTIMLDSRYGDFIVNDDGSLTAITDTSYAGGALTNYTIAAPDGWTGIDKVDVTAGFYSTVDNQGNTDIHGSDVKLTFGFSTTSTTEVDQPLALDFTAHATDADGDSAQVNFTFMTDADHNFIGTDQSDYVVGTDTADTLASGLGDDTLIGGQGDDLLSGGGGHDTFAWQDGDSGTDTISGFTAGPGGDTLNLADLLHNETAETLSNYLSFSYDSNTNSSTIHADIDGVAGGAVQDIVLQGVDITGGGTLTTQQIIDNLQADNNLQTGA